MEDQIYIKYIMDHPIYYGSSNTLWNTKYILEHQIFYGILKI